MDFYNPALGVSTQASSCLPSAAKHSCFLHRHPSLHFFKLRHHAALATALPLCRNPHFSRHSVVDSRNPSVGAVSTVHERRCNGDVRNHGSSTADSCDDDDDDLAAFFSRRATFERIQSSGIVACLRSDNEEVAMNAGRAALNGGVSVLEVTMRTSGAAQVIRKLVEEYPSATIGAGTVLTREDAERAKEAGASFLMSPVANKELIEAHCSSEVLFVPGVMSPSEVLQARRWGASCVKLYPISLVGGMEFVKLLRRLHPSMPIIPANGISLDVVEGYLQAGSTAVVASDAIFNKAALARDDYAGVSHQSKLAAALGSGATRGDTSTLKYTRSGKRGRAGT